jgi:hypothetical protein
MNPERREKGVTKAVKVLKIWDATLNFEKIGYPTFMERFEEGKGCIRTLVNNRQRCSCSMCGNPRKYYNEKTMQEKKADIDFREQLDEAS